MSHEVEHLLEVMFGYEHMLAEFLWNAVFIAATYLFAKGRALSGTHRYIDQKHGIEHDEGY